MARQRFTDEDGNPVKVNRETFRKALSIFRFVRPYRVSFIIGFILLAISSLVFLIFPYMSGEMMDVATGKGKLGYTITEIGLFLLAVLAVQGVVSYTRVMLFARVSERGIADIREALYKKLLSLPITFFEQNRSGELISRITNDVEKLYTAFSITLAEFFRQIILFIGGIIFIALIAPRLSLIMLATLPVIIITAMLFGKLIRNVSKKRQKELADSNIVVGETMQAIHAVKAFTNEWFELVRYGKLNTSIVKISMEYARMRSLMAAFIITVLFGALFFIIYQGAMMVQQGEMSLGQLTNFIIVTGVVGGAIAALGNFYTELIGAVGATERIREILDQQEEVLVSPIAPPNSARPKGEIVFDQVQFAYPSRKDVPVLKDISFTVQPGQRIALVGHSGAGKSTIAQLLLRFYTADGGEIRIDGKPLQDFSISDYRQHLAIVPQDVLLFGGTIQENIAYGKPDASDKEIEEAARRAYAWEFISSFPEGMQTVVGERGIKLSGGQRQRIAIARAILRNPALLILDEATSSLDAESERVVQDALNELMKGRTSIVIAHRLSTIREVDCIYVLDGGYIVEQGTHDELLAAGDGLYAGLAKMQFEATPA